MQKRAAKILGGDESLVNPCGSLPWLEDLLGPVATSISGQRIDICSRIETQLIGRFSIPQPVQIPLSNPFGYLCRQYRILVCRNLNNRAVYSLG